MLVMQPIRGGYGAAFTAPRTPTMSVIGNAALVSRARKSVGINRGFSGGLGDGTPAIPDWAIYAAGGLAAGALVGFIVMKRRKKG